MDYEQLALKVLCAFIAGDPTKYRTGNNLNIQKIRDDYKLLKADQIVHSDLWIPDIDQYRKDGY